MTTTRYHLNNTEFKKIKVRFIVLFCIFSISLIAIFLIVGTPIKLEINNNGDISEKKINGFPYIFFFCAVCFCVGLYRTNKKINELFRGFYIEIEGNEIRVHSDGKLTIINLKEIITISLPPNKGLTIKSLGKRRIIIPQSIDNCDLLTQQLKEFSDKI